MRLLVCVHHALTKPEPASVAVCHLQMQCLVETHDECNATSADAPCPFIGCCGRLDPGNTAQGPDTAVGWNSIRNVVVGHRQEKNAHLTGIAKQLLSAAGSRVLALNIAQGLLSQQQHWGNDLLELSLCLFVQSWILSNCARYILLMAVGKPFDHGMRCSSRCKRCVRL